ncbi:hypothetical protein AGLY_013532 [Aphis glycines]|uniref:Uncharacterized protein n=1 Tax=Aphis glycines TaxID=307491 RepID=A0A6G0T6L3_APHGL|nr:hypothetical protein AGLY_013532 [Aphis glycines]
MKKYTLNIKCEIKKKRKRIQLIKHVDMIALIFFYKILNTMHRLQSYFFLFSAVGNSVMPFPPRPQVPIPTRPLTLSGEANILFFVANASHLFFSTSRSSSNCLNLCCLASKSLIKSNVVTAAAFCPSIKTATASPSIYLHKIYHHPLVVPNICLLISIHLSSLQQMVVYQVDKMILFFSAVNSITSSKSVFSFISSGSSGLFVNAASTYKPWLFVFTVTNQLVNKYQLKLFQLQLPGELGIMQCKLVCEKLFIQTMRLTLPKPYDLVDLLRYINKLYMNLCVS